MIDNTNDNKFKKVKWSKPELLILDFKSTEGGNNPSTVEDTAIDAFSDIPS